MRAIVLQSSAPCIFRTRTLPSLPIVLTIGTEAHPPGIKAHPVVGISRRTPRRRADVRRRRSARPAAPLGTGSTSSPDVQPSPGTAPSPACRPGSPRQVALARALPSGPPLGDGADRRRPSPSGWRLAPGGPGAAGADGGWRLASMDCRPYTLAGQTVLFI